MPSIARTCPTCGGELQATAVRYLGDVELDDTSAITSYRTADCNDADGFAWDHAAVRVYCENDHEIEWEPPLGLGYQRAPE